MVLLVRCQERLKKSPSFLRNSSRTEQPCPLKSCRSVLHEGLTGSLENLLLLFLHQGQRHWLFLLFRIIPVHFLGQVKLRPFIWTSKRLNFFDSRQTYHGITTLNQQHGGDPSGAGATLPGQEVTWRDVEVNSIRTWVPTRELLAYCCPGYSAVSGVGAWDGLCWYRHGSYTSMKI